MSAVTLSHSCSLIELPRGKPLTTLAGSRGYQKDKIKAGIVLFQEKLDAYKKQSRVADTRTVYHQTTLSDLLRIMCPRGDFTHQNELIDSSYRGQKRLLVETSFYSAHMFST
jgi:hypothetical protein